MKINKKLICKFFLFCVVGGFATLIDWGIFNIFSHFLDNSIFMLQVSRVIAIGGSMIWNFLINRKFTFKAGEDKLSNQAVKWLIVYIVTSLINFIIFSLIISLIGGGFWQRNIAYLSGLVVSIPLNFMGSMLWAFKRKN